jgi:hypothetical protein
MIDEARTELAGVGVTDQPGVVLADAGYRHGEQIDRLMGQGVTVLIPPDADKRRGTRPGWDGGRYAFMRNVLANPAAGELYAQRQRMIEPIFADTKFNRRADRFLRRGRAAARSEWRLITATGNLLKLWRHTTAPSGGLTAAAPLLQQRRALPRETTTAEPGTATTSDLSQQPPCNGAAGLRGSRRAGRDVIGRIAQGRREMSKPAAAALALRHPTAQPLLEHRAGEADVAANAQAGQGA